MSPSVLFSHVFSQLSKYTLYKWRKHEHNETVRGNSILHETLQWGWIAYCRFMGKFGSCISISSICQYVHQCFMHSCTFGIPTTSCQFTGYYTRCKRKSSQTYPRGAEQHRLPSSSKDLRFKKSYCIQKAEIDWEALVWLFGLRGLLVLCPGTQNHVAWERKKYHMHQLKSSNFI